MRPYSHHHIPALSLNLLSIVLLFFALPPPLQKHHHITTTVDAAATSCLSGGTAIPLAYQGSASNILPGFYAPKLDTSNTTTHAVACIPTLQCAALRTLSRQCKKLQSAFEPRECNAGYYCPNATTIVTCPKDHYCLFGSHQPTPCPAVSRCPEGSERPQYLGSVILLLVLTMLVVCVTLWYSKFRTLARHGVAHGKPPETHARVLNHGVKRARSETGLQEALSFEWSDLCVSVKKTQSSSSSSSSASSSVKKELPSGDTDDGTKQQHHRHHHDDNNDPHAGNQTILKSCSGSAKPGEVLAIIGPSGAGKSTLMNALLRRLNPDSYTLTGSCTVNKSQNPDEYEKIRPAIAFVPQDDVLHTELSVLDNVFYASELILPRNWKASEREEFRDTIIAMMGLEKRRNTVVGSVEKRGLSGGQIKRTAICTQLAGAPAAIFLDEPTSGVDGYSALRMIKMLKEIAVEAKLTVVMVIHQPRVEIFNALDQLLVLAPGGATVYEGPAKEAIPTLGEFVAVRPQDNPADVLLDVVSHRGAEMAEKWRSGTRPRHTQEKNEELPAATSAAAQGSTTTDQQAKTSTITTAKEEEEQKEESYSSSPPPTVVTTTIEKDESSVSNSIINDHESDNTQKKNNTKKKKKKVTGGGGGGGSGSTRVAFVEPEVAPEDMSIRQAHPFRQFLLFHRRSIQKALATWPFLVLEWGILLVLAFVLAGGWEQFQPRAIYKDEYSRISPQFINTFLPQILMYCSMALGLAGAVAGVKVFGEEKVRFGREADAGLSITAYFFALSLTSLYRVIVSTSVVTTIMHAVGKIPLDYGLYFANYFLLYLNVNAIGGIVSLLTTQQYASVMASTLSIFYSCLNGFIAYPYWLKSLSYAFWSSQQSYVEFFSFVAHMSDPPYGNWGYDATFSPAKGFGVMVGMVVIYNAILLGLLHWSHRIKRAK